MTAAPANTVMRVLNLGGGRLNIVPAQNDTCVLSRRPNHAHFPGYVALIIKVALAMTTDVVPYLLRSVPTLH